MTAPTILYERGILNGTTEEPKQGIYEQSATQQYELGTRLALEDGRAFRYCQAGATALDAGELQQSALFGGSLTTVQTDIAVQAAAAIGDTDVYVTTVTDATTLDQYKGGYFCISDATGQGQMRKIAGNAAGAAGTVKFELDVGLEVAVTTSSKVQLMSNPYKAVLQSVVTTPSGLILGVPTCVIAISAFGWLQTWGMACCLVKTALTMGTNVLYDVAAAGSVGVDDGALINSKVGIAGLVTATTDSGLVFLTIAP